MLADVVDCTGGPKVNRAEAKWVATIETIAISAICLVLISNSKPEIQGGVQRR